MYCTEVYSLSLPFNKGDGVISCVSAKKGDFFCQLNSFLKIIPYFNLISAFMFHFKEMYEILPEWLTKQVQLTVLEGHQKFLEKLSHWG